MIAGTPGIKAGTYFGVPLTIEYIHFLIPFLLGSWWVLPTAEAIGMTDFISVILFLIITLALMEFSLLAHEYGHVRMGQLLGYGTKEVRMLMFGAVAIMAGTGQKAVDSFLIAIIGPIVSALLFCLFMYVLPYITPTSMESDWLFAICYIVAQLNLVLALFNMVPAYPMDGGRVFVSIIWFFNKNFVKAMKIGAVIGMLFSAFGVYYGVMNNAYMLMFIAIMVFIINLKTIRSSYAEIVVMKGGKTI